jgi:RNA-directed DNA polymerase
VNFIFDADIQSFFDTVSQKWLIRFLEHRIGDKRIIRLVQKWLQAGVLEDGVVSVSERGTGQGAVISPLLANLHYVRDLWAERWRRRKATGGVPAASACALRATLPSNTRFGSSGTVTVARSPSLIPK